MRVNIVVRVNKNEVSGKGKVNVIECQSEDDA